MAAVEMSKVWRPVSSATPVSATAKFAETEAPKCEAELSVPSVPNQNAPLTVEVQPLRERAVGTAT